MGAFADALAALRKVVLLDDNVERLQRDVSDLSNDIRRTRDYAAAIDSRVSMIEGTIRGFNMARGSPPALPGE
jgi:hypothetical protein